MHQLQLEMHGYMMVQLRTEEGTVGYRGTQAFVQCAPCGLQASVRQATGAHRHWCSVVLTGRCSGEGEGGSLKGKGGKEQISTYVLQDCEARHPELLEHGQHDEEG